MIQPLLPCNRPSNGRPVHATLQARLETGHLHVEISGTPLPHFGILLDDSLIFIEFESWSKTCGGMNFTDHWGGLLPGMGEKAMRESFEKERAILARQEAWAVCFQDCKVTFPRQRIQFSNWSTTPGILSLTGPEREGSKKQIEGLLWSLHIP